MNNLQVSQVNLKSRDDIRLFVRDLSESENSVLRERLKTVEIEDDTGELALMSLLLSKTVVNEDGRPAFPTTDDANKFMETASRADCWTLIARGLASAR